MLAPSISSIVVSGLVGVVALVSYTIHAIKPKRVKLSVGVGKMLHFKFEADGGTDPPKELRPGPDEGDRA
jgi:hypothetical protein